LFLTLKSAVLVKIIATYSVCNIYLRSELVSTRSHIVHFSTRSQQSDLLKEYRPLPVLIKNIQTLCVDELVSNLVKMFETADDRLFDMAETSYNNAQFDAMRLLRIKRDGLINCFKQEIINNFKQTLGKVDGIERSTDNVEELSFENIALVKDDELEEDIATDAMINKAKSKNQNALEHIRIRMDTIISDKSIDQTNNPFEPVYICDAFRTASQTLDLDIESLLIIYKLFDRSVIGELESVYYKINQFFIEKGILPELKNGSLQKQQSRQSYSQSQSHQDAQNVIESLAINQDNTNRPEVSGFQESAESGNVLGVIQQLLSNQRTATTSPAGSQIPVLNSEVLQNYAPVPQKIDTQQLVHALSNIQLNPLPDSLVAGQFSQQTLRESLGSQLPNIEDLSKQGALGQFNEDMIDVISMLFDFILEDENLHSDLKSVIARLQIPMLKVGLVDKSFFSDRRHPARQLLNELAHAGLSWDKKDPSAHSMFEKISVTAERVIQEFNNDISIFKELLEDFLAFKKQNQQRSKIFERRTKEAEEGKAKSESARAEVNKTLTALCQGKKTPDVVKSILKKVWSHIMLLERLKNNEEGWKKLVKVAQLLIWSVQPFENAERLDKLTSKVPLLVKHLHKGMQVISYSPIESSHLFEQLETCHRDVIEKARVNINLQNEEQILRLPVLDVSQEINFSNEKLTQSHKLETNNALAKTEADETLLDGSKTEEHFIEKIDIEEPAIEDIVIEDIGFSKIETGEHQQAALVEPVNIDANIRQTIEQLRAGSWIELMIDDEFKRCKLAARISSTGKYIFVNRSGMKMAEFFTNELCQQLQLKKMKVLDDDALFDRALESVISNLRSLKAQA